jgi:hypothetical protein
MGVIGAFSVRVDSVKRLTISSSVTPLCREQVRRDDGLLLRFSADDAVALAAV